MLTVFSPKIVLFGPGLTWSKGKVCPYSLLSIGPGADPGVQAVSPQVTLSHPPNDRLSLLSARPVFTFLAPSVGQYQIIPLSDRGKQLAQGCYLEADHPRFKLATF